jgi:hypothetical protein
MVHGEHNKSRNNGGFALIILGALLLFLAPNIYQDMRELGTMSLIGGIIIGSIGFYLIFFKGRVKQELRKVHFLEKVGERYGVFW